MASTPASDRRLLTLEVARRHYVDGWSKKDIGERLSLSRFQVARMLERALQHGWVQITIAEPDDVDTELGDRVREAYGLRHALVASAATQDVSSRARTAQTAARFLEDVLGPDDLLGLAWSRTINATVERLEHVPHIPVVQLSGALAAQETGGGGSMGSGGSIEGGSIEMVRRFAALSREAAYLYYAPMILPDAATAATLRTQSDIARTLELFDEVTTAVVAIGHWTAGGSTIFDAVGPAERRALDRRGVVGEVSGLFIDADAQPVRTDLSDRMLCPSADDLRTVDHVVALAHGTGRGAAVDAALRSGLITSVVLDADLAQEVLRIAESRPPG